MSSSVSASTHDSLTLSHSLDLPALPWAKTRVALRILPPRSPNPLVWDPRGPPRLLRIREDILDNVIAKQTQEYEELLHQVQQLQTIVLTVRKQISGYELPRIGEDKYPNELQWYTIGIVGFLKTLHLVIQIHSTQ